MESIAVCVRIKPRQSSDGSLWKIEGNNLLSVKSKEIFSFDRIIMQEETNEIMFRTTVKDKIENFLNGINVSIFAYGQTSTGKTHTMKGSSSLNGVIPMAIKEILTKLNEEKGKWSLKGSYLEIYNETVNDLLDKDKKNLEIRESLQRGVFVNNLTEVTIDSFEKGVSLLKQGDAVRVIAETKLNEKSSRSHTLFKLSLEIAKIVDGSTKMFSSTLNLIDLAGSENVNKANTEGIRMKEGSNINKSLLALSNVIGRLSKDPKSFVNYRDSKLTRLLQPCLSGNSKTMIICTITEANANYAETLNTLHFGLKAKHIKTSIKVNEVCDEKTKIMKENTQLKSKIKQLEDMIKEKKDPEEGKSNFDMISALEKEVQLLKKILINNEEIGETEIHSVSNNDILSIGAKENNWDTQSSYNVPYGYQNIQMSASKYNKPSMTSMLMSSGKKMTDSARKIKDDGFLNSEIYANSNFRRSMTDMKNNFAPSVFNSSMQNSCSQGINNYLMNTASKKMFQGSAYKQCQNENDYEFLYPGQSDNSFQLLKENDELRKNLYEVRKNFIETVQSKENQIRSLNFYVTQTNENCEKIIREAEENYINLKLDYNRTREDVQNKDTEIKNLNQTIRNLEANSNFYKEEINKVKSEMNCLNESLKGDKIYKDLECKYVNLDKSYDTLHKLYESDKNILNDLKIREEKYRNENSNLKLNLENYKSENMSLSTQYDIVKKNLDILINENSKLKNDIESYKNEINTYRDKLNKVSKEKKGPVVQSTVNTQNLDLENKIIAQSAQISHLESEVEKYKQNLIKIETTQINEYQKLLDESFNKITEIQNELEITSQKNEYLEKVLKLKSAKREQTETKAKETPLKPEISINQSGKVVDSKISQFSLITTPTLQLKDENLDNGFAEDNSNGKDFIGKKRKYLNRVYQNIIDKNLNRDTDSKREDQTQKLQKTQEKENYFSTFEY